MANANTKSEEREAKGNTSKSDAVHKLLRRGSGATIVEITAATGWQPHSARAFLSGLRKKNLALTREQRRDGISCYRFAKPSEAKATGSTEPSADSTSAPEAATTG